MTTEFDLLEGQDGRLFLYIHTGMTSYTLELDREEEDQTRLLQRLGEQPTPIDRQRRD